MPARRCGLGRLLCTAEACQQHCMGLLGGDEAAVMLFRHCMLAVLAALTPCWLLGVQVSFSDAADANNGSTGAGAAQSVDVNVE